MLNGLLACSRERHDLCSPSATSIHDDRDTTRWLKDGSPRACLLSCCRACPYRTICARPPGCEAADSFARTPAAYPLESPATQQRIVFRWGRRSSDLPVPLDEHSAHANYVMRQFVLESFFQPLACFWHRRPLPGSTCLGRPLAAHLLATSHKCQSLAKYKNASFVILAVSFVPLVPDQHLEHISRACAGASLFPKSVDTPP